MVRVFDHGVMGHWIDPSWWTHWAISCSSQCPMTGITKASGMVHTKEPLLLIGRIAHVVAEGILSHYLTGPLPYVQCHITKNVLSTKLNKTFPSFLYKSQHWKLVTAWTMATQHLNSLIKTLCKTLTDTPATTVNHCLGEFLYCY